MSTLRRSSRRKPAGTPKIVEDADNEYEEPVRPSVKRKVAASQTSKPRKRLLGRVQEFLQLPSEVLLCVLEYLGPKTLINISRTNQYLRNLLLSLDSVWKRCRLRAGMPNLEAQDMTERQYILLLWDKSCHDCGKPKVQDTMMDWINCARLCKQCNHNTKIKAAARRNLFKTLHPKTEECAKITHAKSLRVPRGIYKLSEKLNRMSKSEVDAFVEERKALRISIAHDAETIVHWLQEEASAKHTDLLVAARDRATQVKSRLLALGWSEEAFDVMENWQSSTYVDQPRRLTDAIWKRIQGPLVLELQDMLIRQRNASRRWEIGLRYNGLFEANALPDLFPSKTTFLGLPSVKALHSDTLESLGSPLDMNNLKTFDEDRWSAAQSSIETDVLAYQQDMEQLALSRLVSKYTAAGIPVPESPLNDARSNFRYVQRTTHGWGALGVVLPFPAIHAKMRDMARTYSWPDRDIEFNTTEGVTGVNAPLSVVLVTRA